MSYRRTEKVERHLAQRHAAIMAAARNLAAEAGLSALQIAAVAQRAGIAAGTIYRYFPSKTELIATLIAAVCEEEIGAVQRAADAAPGSLSALTSGVATLAARMLREGRLAWAVFAEPLDAEAGQLRRVYRVALQAEFEARIRAAIRDGHLPDQDAQIAAVAAVGALLDPLIEPPPDHERRGTWQAAQSLTVFVLRGLGLKEARALGLAAHYGAAFPGAAGKSHMVADVSRTIPSR